jgi:hypothetical protein
MQLERGTEMRTAVLRAVTGEQARLAGDEGDRVAGPNRLAAALAGIGVETARTVERQQGTMVTRTRAHWPPHELAMATADRSLQADAEQTRR